MLEQGGGNERDERKKPESPKTEEQEKYLMRKALLEDGCKRTPSLMARCVRFARALQDARIVQDAEDLFQDCCAAFLNAKDYDPSQGAFERYFFTCYKNRINKHWRELADKKKAEEKKTEEGVKAEDNRRAESVFDAILNSVFAQDLFWRCGGYPHQQLAAYLSMLNDSANSDVAAAHGDKTLQDIAQTIDERIRQAIERATNQEGDLVVGLSLVQDAFRAYLKPRCGLSVSAVFGKIGDGSQLREPYEHLSKRRQGNLGALCLRDYARKPVLDKGVIANWKNRSIDRVKKHIQTGGGPQICTDGRKCPIQNINQYRGTMC